MGRWWDGAGARLGPMLATLRGLTKMKAIVRGAVISGAGALLLGTSLALSSAMVVSGATTTHRSARAAAKSETCNIRSVCFTVSNSGVGGSAIEGGADTGYGIWGDSSNNVGVYGTSSGSVGVEGEASGSNAGVYGDAQGSGAGVSGVSSSGNGISGQASSGIGVFGESSSNFGIEGQSTNGIAVYGDSTNSYAASFQSDSTEVPTLAADNSAAGGYVLWAVNSATSDSLLVDAYGDGIFDGYVEADGGYYTVRRARDGLRLEAFGPESTRATIEDTGTARLEAGEGAVRFDSAFANTIDAARGYQVFLTPDGDTRGLFVAAKYEGGFVVRETEHGHSSLYFDYRVVAHPYGASDARLPQVEIKRPPMPRLPKLRQP